MIHHRQTQEVQLSQFDGAPREELLQSVDYLSKLQHGYSGMFVTPEFTKGRVACATMDVPKKIVNTYYDFNLQVPRE